MFVELFKHKERILKHSQAKEEDVLEYLSSALHYIHFVNEDFIPASVYMQAFNLIKDVDEEDTPFVAMSLALECEL